MAVRPGDPAAEDGRHGRAAAPDPWSPPAQPYPVMRPGADLHPTGRPVTGWRRSWRVGAAFWARLAGAFTLAVLVVLVLPLDRGGTDVPPQLAWLLLGGQGASVAARDGFAVLVAALYAASYLSLARRPDEVLIGYKG
jgi:hypothetical protein